MTCRSKTKFKKLKAFTLVEVLIALMITSIIGGSAVSLLYTYLKNYEQSSEYTTALQRGQMVLSYLEPAVLSAGLGMPSKAIDYSHCVESDPLLKSWKNPVSITDGGGRIRLVYALPLDMVTDKMIDFEPGESVPVSLFKGYSTDIDISYSYTSTSGIDKDKKWVSFLSVGVPSVTESTTSPLDLLFKGPRPVTSAQYDSLLRIRTMEAYVTGDAFCVKDNGALGAQPVVRGVLKIYFQELSGDVIKVSVLTRGDSKNSSMTPQDAIPWPNAADMPTSDEYQYKLVLTSAVWRVRNR